MEHARVLPRGTKLVLRDGLTELIVRDDGVTIFPPGSMSVDIYHVRNLEDLARYGMSNPAVACVFRKGGRSYGFDKHGELMEMHCPRTDTFYNPSSPNNNHELSEAAPQHP